MPNRCCDRIDIKTARLRRGWHRVWPRFKPLTPLSMIPHKVETQLIATRTFPVSVSGLIPSPSVAHAGVENAHPSHGDSSRISTSQLSCQTLALQDPPRILVISNRYSLPFTTITSPEVSKCLNVWKREEEEAFYRCLILFLRNVPFMYKKYVCTFQPAQME